MSSGRLRNNSNSSIDKQTDEIINIAKGQKKISTIAIIISILIFLVGLTTLIIKVI